MLKSSDRLVHDLELLAQRPGEGWGSGAPVAERQQHEEGGEAAAVADLGGYASWHAEEVAGGEPTPSQPVTNASAPGHGPSPYGSAVLVLRKWCEVWVAGLLCVFYHGGDWGIID